MDTWIQGHHELRNLDWIAKIFLFLKSNTNLVLEAHKNPLLNELHIAKRSVFPSPFFCSWVYLAAAKTVYYSVWFIDIDSCWVKKVKMSSQLECSLACLYKRRKGTELIYGYPVCQALARRRAWVVSGIQVQFSVLTLITGSIKL